MFIMHLILLFSVLVQHGVQVGKVRVVPQSQLSVVSKVSVGEETTRRNGNTDGGKKGVHFKGNTNLGGGVLLGSVQKDSGSVHFGMG